MPTANTVHLDQLGTLMGDRDVWARSIVKSKKKSAKTTVAAVDLEKAITGIRFGDTMKGSSTMELTLKDDGWEITDSGFFDANGDGKIDPIDVNYPVGSDQWWRITQAGLDSTRGGADLTLTFMERAAVDLMHHYGPVKVSRAKRTRAEFLKLLHQRVKAHGGIDFHSKELTVKQDIQALSKSEKLAKKKSEADRRTTKDGGINKDEKIVITSWDGGKHTLTPGELRNAERMLHEAVSHTTDDRPLLALLEAGIVEAPFFANPLGGDASSVGILQLLASHGPVSKRRDIAWVTAQFLEKGFTGAGGAIALAKAHKDWTPGQIAQAVQGSAFPDRYEKVRKGAQKVLDAYGGAGLGGGEYTKQYNFQVGSTDHPHEDFWAAINRLASEVEWAYFLDGQNAYFDAELTLIKQKPVAVIRRNDPAVVRFSSNWDQRHIATEATLILVCDPFEFRAGEVFKLEGFGPASSGSTAKPPLPGRWLISESDRDRFDVTTTFTLKQPTRPKKEPRSETAQKSPAQPTGTRGDVKIDPGANRAGVPLHRHVIAFLELVAGQLDREIVVTTGSNHSQFASSGLQSDHWTGDAADLGSVRNHFAIGGRGGDEIAAACAKVLGVDKSRCIGTYVRINWHYATKEYSVQVLWKVADHYDHVHVGVREITGAHFGPT